MAIYLWKIVILMAIEMFLRDELLIYLSNMVADLVNYGFWKVLWDFDGYGMSIN